MIALPQHLQVPFSVLAVLGGFGLLWMASKKVIESAMHLAKLVGCTTFLIGSIISAILTSFPELVVSMASIFQGEPQVSLGNIFGANLCDLTLALSIPMLFCARLMVTKTEVESLLFMLMMSGLTMLLFLTPGVKPALIGPIMIIVYGFIIYSLIDRNRTKPAARKKTPKGNELLMTAGKLVVSLAGAAIAGNLVVLGAKIFSHRLEVMIETIGASAFAIGTTIPEIAVNIAAARAKQTGFIFGNAIGSALSQTLLALGLLATFAPELNLPRMSFAVPWIFLIYFVLGFALYKNREVRRLEAITLTALFAGFVTVALKLGYA